MPAPLITVALGLAQYAPQLMRFFGAGEDSTAVAEKVVAMAQSVTGGQTPEQALERLREDAQMQQAFRLATLQQDGDLERAFLADRQDARKRDIALAQMGQRNYRADIMVAVDAFGLVVCLIVLTVFGRDLPGEAVALISTIASVFGLCLRDAHQYEFGSSRGSAMKSQDQAATLAALTSKARGADK